jgi:PleD family two-component response regulator
VQNVAPQASSSVAVANDRFLEEIRKRFFGSLPSALSDLRVLLTGLLKAETGPVRLECLRSIHSRIRSLTEGAGPAGVVLFVRMADALGALLKELQTKPDCITSSSMRTIASGIDSLNALAQLPTTADQQDPLPPSILVVDDDPISRLAVTRALEKAKLRSVGVSNPLFACELLADNRFDLVFLDIGMPEMSGHELCVRLRAMPAHNKTPVIFVTGLNDFDSRANSSRIGGTDFIAKPFLLSELAVKALYYLLRARLTLRR